jgi:hypothetical protein
VKADLSQNLPIKQNKTKKKNEYAEHEMREQTNNHLKKRMPQSIILKSEQPANDPILLLSPGYARYSHAKRRNDEVSIKKEAQKFVISGKEKRLAKDLLPSPLQSPGFLDGPQSLDLKCDTLAISTST